jgi:hypothetical protein
MKVKLVNKIGLWVIAGSTLLALLLINIFNKQELVNVVAVSAIIALAVWMIAMAVWSRWSR